MENQRTRLSKQMMRNALIQLLKEKELYQITVKEICTLAEINRTTFYKYYAAPADLLSEIAEDFAKKNASFFQGNPTEDGRRFENFLAFAKENKDLYLLATKSPSLSAIFSHTDFVTKNAILEEHLGEPDYAKYEYISKFFAAGCNAVIISWLNKEDPESIAYIKKIILGLFSYVE